MKEIGGYFGLECGNNALYYEDGIYLNSCRNALRYLIRALGIKEIYIPYYTCHVVPEAIQKESSLIHFYHLDQNLYPVEKLPIEAFILYSNYFGVCGEKVHELSKIYPNLIVDNAQAFYSTPKCRAAIYSPRKFFGLPDGGILRGQDIPNLELKQGSSFEICSHLLKRLDKGAEEGYIDFTSNDKALDNYEVERMSKLTYKLMGNINYLEAKNKRIHNFKTLHEQLNSTFPFAMNEEDVPLIYPYITTNDKMKNELIASKIFVPIYWPNIFKQCKNNSIEYDFAKKVVSLPIDQRYNIEDMQYIINVIQNINYA